MGCEPPLFVYWTIIGRALGGEDSVELLQVDSTLFGESMHSEPSLFSVVKAYAASVKVFVNTTDPDMLSELVDMKVNEIILFDALKGNAPRRASRFSAMYDAAVGFSLSNMS